MATEEQVRFIAQRFMQECGFGWCDDPMEGGQDVYEMCQDALVEARTWLSFLEPLPSEGG